MHRDTIAEPPRSRRKTDKTQNDPPVAPPSATAETDPVTLNKPKPKPRPTASRLRGFDFRPLPDEATPTAFDPPSEAPFAKGESTRKPSAPNKPTKTRKPAQASTAKGRDDEDYEDVTDSQPSDSELDAGDLDAVDDDDDLAAGKGEEEEEDDDDDKGPSQVARDADKARKKAPTKLQQRKLKNFNDSVSHLRLSEVHFTDLPIAARRTSRHAAEPPADQ